MTDLSALAEKVEGLTEAQRRVLKMVERLGLVEERLPDVVHLTAAGRAALLRAKGASNGNA